jgi:hypothetical protein
MSSDKNKPSVDELQQQIGMYQPVTKKKLSVTKSKENPNDMVTTPEMGCNIVLSILLKGE